MLTVLLMSAAIAAAPVETQVEIAAPTVTLKATMLAPASRPRAGVVILPGSGPTDRDGNNTLGVNGATYRVLAEGLAGEGVASLRMDKRGLFGSASLAVDPNAVTVEMLAEDAAAWARDLKTRTGLKCVWLAGHSEGGLVALIAGGKANDDICGLVLISAPGRPLGTVLREQLQANPANAPVLPQAMHAIDELEAGRKVDVAGMHPGLLALFRPQVQDFLIVMFRQDPVRLAAGVTKPMLILQGDADVQVTVADAAALKAAQPRASMVILGGVNHILRPGTTDRAETRANYAAPSPTLAPGVVEAIAGFVTSQPGMN
ncbi:MAG TPA: alpha/beta fold hydrolase [Caulobacter sp.]|nr:alpha/beta fold hydrolase [Caulobacter sp.]